MSRIKVLVVDDSAVVRKVLTELLKDDPAIDVIGAASDPVFAMERMKVQWPDVILMDVEMPRMDGITFLKKIMQERPTPVVICSTLTQKGAETTVQALAAGAVEVVSKPTVGLKDFLEGAGNELIRVVKAASQARVGKIRMPAVVPKLRELPGSVRPVTEPVSIRTTERVVALGTSTGGTQALETVLTRLPRVSPGIVIVQHMPERFTAAFADRLNKLCEIEVREAKDGDRVMPGCALIAPGGKHMQMRRNGAQYQVEVIAGPPVNRHCPSVDVLFRSVAKSAGRNAIGIIMTGMGDDGARGLLELRDAGATTFGQDEASCVVYGMPKEAVKLGAVGTVVSLDQIPSVILGMRKAA